MKKPPKRKLDTIEDPTNKHIIEDLRLLMGYPLETWFACCFVLMGFQKEFDLLVEIEKT